MDILEFILEDGLIMIPALYVIANIIKNLEMMNKKYIPVIVLICSLILSPLILLGGYTASNIVQSILIAGATVFTHELIEVRKEG